MDVHRNSYCFGDLERDLEAPSDLLRPPWDGRLTSPRFCRQDFTQEELDGGEASKVAFALLRMIAPRIGERAISAVGIAAPQAYVPPGDQQRSAAVIVMIHPDSQSERRYEAFANVKLIRTVGEQVVRDSCLTTGTQFAGLTVRPQQIWFEGYQVDPAPDYVQPGHWGTFYRDGLSAAAFSHELDHLYGRFFKSRIQRLQDSHLVLPEERTLWRESFATTAPELPKGPTWADILEDHYGPERAAHAYWSEQDWNEIFIPPTPPSFS